MTEARYWSVTNESSMPCRLSSSKMWPRHGLLTMGTIGFGRLIVSGRSRLPSPPAMTTACMKASLVRGCASSGHAARSHDDDGVRDGDERRRTKSGPIRSDREHRLEVVPRICLERDVCRRFGYARNLRDPTGHDVGELVVLSCADHRDEVDLAGDRIDL